MQKNTKRNCIIKFIGILLSLLLFLPPLSSCTERRSAEDILFDITKDLTDLPDGKVYLSGAAEGSEGFLIPSVINALYYEGAAKNEFSLIEEYAIYVSDFAKPCEVAVYKCFSRSDTGRIAAMCLRRIENLCVILKGTSFFEITQRAKVDVKGRCVIVTMV